MKKEQVEDQENQSLTEDEVTENVENRTEEEANTDNPTDEITEEVNDEEKLKAELADAKEKYLRLYSEFENFRRRTAKERLDLISTASEDIISALLPVLDDFERAENSNKDAGAEAMKEGFNLIHHKFRNVLEQKGLKLMESGQGSEFDSEIHEAITQIPAPDKKLEGKVVDVIEKGYYLGEKVIRFAKVVIGAKK